MAPARKSVASLKDVARVAGVSMTTVSRYVNRLLDLPPDTAKRIEHAIRALKYQPNPHARRLSLGRADTIGADHPILAGLDGEWPFLLGANEIIVRDRSDVEILARLPEEQGAHPLLVTGTHGKGRSAAWASDIGPHWVPQAFCDWHGYGRLWTNLLTWLTPDA
jgi:hypothetical protein